MRKLSTLPPLNSLTPFEVSGLLRQKSIYLLKYAENVFENPLESVKWFNSTNSGLNNKKPIDLLTSFDGCELVQQTLLKIEHGVYS